MKNILNRLLQFFSTLFSSGDEVSSKRFNGTLGWIVCLGITIYCTLAVIQAPLIVETIVWASAGLLGLDTIRKVFDRNNRRNQDNENCENEESNESE